MNLIEATIATAYYPAHKQAERLALIADLVAGTWEFCDACGWAKPTVEVCEVCESAWADEQAAFAEAMEDGRVAVQYARY